MEYFGSIKVWDESKN